MTLRINPIVVEDLKSIREFIREDNPEMAVKIIEFHNKVRGLTMVVYTGIYNITRKH